MSFPIAEHFEILIAFHHSIDNMSELSYLNVSIHKQEQFFCFIREIILYIQFNFLC